MSRQSAGGGGGGLTITGWATDQFTQDTNFTAGALTLTLSQTPLTPTCVLLSYNPNTLYKGFTWTLSGNIITITFSDPYVQNGDTPGYFQAIYPY